MALPSDPLVPMEARSVAALPAGPGWQYEPKWDGFRCLAARDGADLALHSKSGQPLARYFPDVAAALASLPALRFVLDGELVVPVGGVPDFAQTQMRLHPAASRVRSLAAAHPACLIAFDLLVAAEGTPTAAEPLRLRRAALEAFLAANPHPALRLSPASTDRAQAERWLARGEAGCDGVMAKRLDAAYQPGGRDAMVKVKRQRTADCVVGGWRTLQGGEQVGSLLLGLYDAAGRLDHVGFTSGIATADRAAWTERLRRLHGAPSFTGRAPGGPSRWNRGEEKPWHSLRPELVVEVAYDHVSDGRFRHGTRLLRLRPDKAPAQCGLEQIAPSLPPPPLPSAV